MKLILRILLSIIILFVLVAAGGLFYLTRGLDQGADLGLQGINVTSLDDGSYIGKYKGGRWSNELNVIVRDRKITQIEIIKDLAFVKPGIKEQLFDRVIERQNTTVDAVSEATVTSKAYLKSIENALSNPGK